MKTKQKLNIGGDLDTGDVVGIAYNNCIVFGWYVEEGLNGSLKFIPLSGPERTKTQYDEHISGKNTNQWVAKRFAKGFTYKNISRDYIISFGPYNNRAIKITDPEKFFDGSEQQKTYNASKQILTDLKFPAK